MAWSDISVVAINKFLWSWPVWPLPIFLCVVGLTITFLFNFVQIRYFFTSWKYVFFPKKEQGESTGTISPIQAFFTTLGAVLGNGSLVGMASAMYAGGPGGAFWLIVFGFIAMPIRFAEVLASSVFTVDTTHGKRGGPMVYLGRVPGGKFLPYIFSFLCLLYCLVAASMMQSNSMAGGITNITGASDWLVALVIFVFIGYIMLGGAQRVIKFAETVAPVKVILFLIATGTVIIYFLPQFFVAIKIMVKSAFAVKAVAGGLLGHVMQNAVRLGIGRAINASETGLGSSSVMFGATGGKNPVESSIMSMALVFIIESVCFLIMLAFTMSGTWNSGANGMALVISTYSSVFGALGAWVATTLSVLFGVGTLVGYAFIGRECWFFLTKGRWEWLFMIIYCVMAPIGALSAVDFVWDLLDLVVACLMICNLYGIFYLLPQLRRKWRELRA